MKRRERVRGLQTAMRLNMRVRLSAEQAAMVDAELTQAHAVVDAAHIVADATQENMPSALDRLDEALAEYEAGQ